MPTFLLLLTLLLPRLAQSDEGLQFSFHGRPVCTLTRAQMLASVGAQTATVWEPHQSVKVAYRGLPANALLDKVYGGKWRRQDDLLFTCRDGYQPVLPVSRFLRYQSWFAFEKPGSSFTVVNKLQANEKVELGPFYLVWNNIRLPALRAQKGHGWPYQLTAVDLVDVAQRFPHMYPGSRASAQVKRGFEGFREYCFSCHQVNGDGGSKGPDLNQPLSVTRRYDDAWLRRWIVNAPKIAPGTTMPALVVEGTEGQRLAADIVAYLKHMSYRK